MRTDKFNEVIERRLEAVRSTLISKAKEYADNKNDNRMHNFDKGSKFTGEKREDVLLGFAMKHWISVTDILDKMDDGELPSRNLLDEKLGDWIVYMCLLEASIVDKINHKELPF